MGTVPGDSQGTKGTHGHPPHLPGEGSTALLPLASCHHISGRGRGRRRGVHRSSRSANVHVSCHAATRRGAGHKSPYATHTTDRFWVCVRVGGGRAAIGSNVSSVRRLRSAELSEESSLASRGGGGEGGSLQARPGPQAPPGPPRRPQASRSGQGRGATAAPGSRPRSGPGAARGRRKSPAAPPRRLRVLGRPRPRREPPARLPSLPSPRRPRPRSGGRPRSPGTQTMSGPNSPVAPGLRGSGGGSPAPSPFSPPPPRSDIRTRREPSPLLPSPPREPPAAPPPRAKSLYSPLQHGCFPRRRLSAAPQRNAAAGRAGSRTLPVPSAEPRVSRSGPSAARGRAEPGYASPLRAAASARSQRTEPAPPAARAQEGPRGRPDAGDT